MDYQTAINLMLYPKQVGNKNGYLRLVISIYQTIPVLCNSVILISQKNLLVPLY